MTATSRKTAGHLRLPRVRAHTGTTVTEATAGDTLGLGTWWKNTKIVQSFPILKETTMNDGGGASPRERASAVVSRAKE